MLLLVQAKQKNEWNSVFRLFYSFLLKHLQRNGWLVPLHQLSAPISSDLLELIGKEVHLQVEF